MGIVSFFRSQEKLNEEILLASMMGDYYTAKKLIKKKANVNYLHHHKTKALKITPLIAGIISNNIHIVALLLENGADINLPDNREMYPIHYAAIYGYIEIVNLLLENGADPLKTDNSNLTPQQLAEKHSHLEIASLLTGVS